METTETTVSPEATQETAQATETTETVLDTATEPTTEATVIDNGETVSETIYADKYNSVGELESAYKELQSTFGKKMGAFEGYNAEEGYSLPEGEMTAEQQSQVDFLQTWGAENQLSNTGLNSLAQAYSEHQNSQHQAKMDEAYKQLGENADRRLANVRDYLTANLGEDATKALAKNMNDAESIIALEKLISGTKGSQPAPVQQTTTLSKEKVEAMRFAVDENGDRRMSVDPAYRQQVMNAEAKLRGEKPGYLAK